MYPAIPSRRDHVHPAIVAMERRSRQRFHQWLNRHPPGIPAALYDRWKQTRARRGEAAANRELREFAESTDYLLPPSIGETGVRTWAEKRAQSVRQALGSLTSIERQYTRAAHIVERFGLAPPEPGQRMNLTGCVRRMRCPRWWRRQAWGIYLRRNEQKARELGLVSNHKSLYVSIETYRRWQERQGANARTLADTLAVNDHGEAFSLSELIARSVANPTNRRNETMMRIGGFEDYADRQGHQALFVTVTAPSTYHAVRHQDGALLEGAKESPRAAQQWLQKRWAQLRAALKRRHITVYGIRVVEPHHDGTPHWHLLLFAPAGQARAIIELLEGYFIEEAASAARKAHGLGVEWIDHAKGRATGYIAKYIAKNIDGVRTGIRLSVDETGEPVEVNTAADEAAARVRAWASTWSVRQFQFFGGPPVTLWRELRRLEPVSDNPTLEQLRVAADDGDWERYVTYMGGAATVRNELPAYITYQRSGQVGEYGEWVRVPAITSAGRKYETRLRTWELIYLPGAADLIAQSESAAPWSSVNNCTQHIDAATSSVAHAAN